MIINVRNSLQPHAETRAKQITAWRNLVLEYCKNSKRSTIDTREPASLPVFTNPAINRELNQQFVRAILNDLQRTGNAEPLDKNKNRWEVYWHTLDEWGAIIYDYVSAKGFSGAVLTLFELNQGEDTVDEEFHGLEHGVLLKALQTLEKQGKCELIVGDGEEGVKFF